jgi:Holliday junction resolvasome RuvABC endonuclease subunit
VRACVRACVRVCEFVCAEQVKEGWVGQGSTSKTKNTQAVKTTPHIC